MAGLTKSIIKGLANHLFGKYLETPLTRDQIIIDQGIINIIDLIGSVDIINGLYPHQYGKVKSLFISRLTCGIEFLTELNTELSCDIVEIVMVPNTIELIDDYFPAPVADHYLPPIIPLITELLGNINLKIDKLIVVWEREKEALVIQITELAFLGMTKLLLGEFHSKFTTSKFYIEPIADIGYFHQGSTPLITITSGNILANSNNHKITFKGELMTVIVDSKLFNQLGERMSTPKEEEFFDARDTEYQSWLQGELSLASVTVDTWEGRGIIINFSDDDYWGRINQITGKWGGGKDITFKSNPLELTSSKIIIADYDILSLFHNTTSGEIKIPPFTGKADRVEITYGQYRGQIINLQITNTTVYLEELIWWLEDRQLIRIQGINYSSSHNQDPQVASRPEEENWYPFTIESSPQNRGPFKQYLAIHEKNPHSPPCMIDAPQYLLFRQNSLIQAEYVTQVKIDRLEIELRETSYEWLINKIPSRRAPINFANQVTIDWVVISIIETNKFTYEIVLEDSDYLGTDDYNCLNVSKCRVKELGQRVAIINNLRWRQINSLNIHHLDIGAIIFRWWGPEEWLTRIINFVAIKKEADKIDNKIFIVLKKAKIIIHHSAMLLIQEEIRYSWTSGHNIIIIQGGIYININRKMKLTVDNWRESQLVPGIRIDSLEVNKEKFLSVTGGIIKVEGETGIIDNWLTIINEIFLTIPTATKPQEDNITINFAQIQGRWVIENKKIISLIISSPEVLIQGPGSIKIGCREIQMSDVSGDIIQCGGGKFHLLESSKGYTMQVIVEPIHINLSPEY